MKVSGLNYYISVIYYIAAAGVSPQFLIATLHKMDIPIAPKHLLPFLTKFTELTELTELNASVFVFEISILETLTAARSV